MRISWVIPECSHVNLFEYSLVCSIVAQISVSLSNIEVTRAVTFGLASLASLIVTGTLTIFNEPTIIISSVVSPGLIEIISLIGLTFVNTTPTSLPSYLVF